jgi:hypothetical protein
MSIPGMNLRCLLLLAAAALAFAGCSTFNYEWRQAAKKPMPTNAITGRWEGHWFSEPTGHRDRMRALVTSVDTTHYDVKFHAAYKSETFKIITVHFGYTVRMEARPGPNGIAFHGSEDLGAIAGGVYTYDGYANATNFFSTYEAKRDRGTFEMKRPRR